MQFTFTVAQIAKALTHLKSITECHLLLLIKKATIESWEIAKG